MAKGRKRHKKKENAACSKCGRKVSGNRQAKPYVCPACRNK